jgi:hypothetical protein
MDAGAVCGWLLPVSLVTYLGVRQGGYDPIISSQIGIAAWWLILLLFAFRLVRVRLTASGCIGLGLLVAYAGWTTLSLSWTVSAESTMTDVSQMLLYVALALLVFLVQGREAIRYMLHGLGTAIVAIAILALLSRLHFQWFAVPGVAISLPHASHRLSYPIDYWNALAALMAIGIPVLLYSASAARTLLARAAAGACLPLLALCAFLTASRGGVIEIGVGLVLFLALAPERLPKLAIMLVGGAGSALLVAAASQRGAVRNGLRTALAAHQGSQMIVITVTVALAVGMLVGAIVLVERHVNRPRLLAISRRQMTLLSGIGGLIAVIAFIAAGGPAFANREWNQFKSAAKPPSASHATALQRLQSVAGEGRYQYWQAAVRETNSRPLTGTGAGTFQFWWAQHGTVTGGFVLDAHSLYLQALGELGYPGLILIACFIAWILMWGVWRVIRSHDVDQRLALAAASAGAFVFATSAAVEWIWFIPALPVALFVLAGVLFAPEVGGNHHSSSARIQAGARSRLRELLCTRAARYGTSAAVAVASLVSIVVIALPMAATAAVRKSQTLVQAGNLPAALARAIEAEHLQPYAATPWLQEALVEEQAGDITAAVVAARHATANEPTSSNNWLVLSRLEARAGHASTALADYRRADRLNPYSPIFSIK